MTEGCGGSRLKSKRPKLIALLLVTVVIAAGLGYWILMPKMPSEAVSYTGQQVSLTESSEQARSSSTSSTTIAVSVSATQSVSYYLGLLEANGTAPYVQLAGELRKLPDLTNATAVAKITYLALNSTNPEVREAFELIMKGGTPDPRDFTYTVPKYNTELQVLYWLALQNEFKKDDTLALAIAMVNGLWVTMGVNQVGEAVKIDTSDLLAFFRETNELQKQAGYYQLENHPLEAKLALAWTGNECAAGFGENRPHRLFDYTDKSLTLNAYRWNVVEVETLRQMRKLMVGNGWIANSVDRTVANLEYYFYFNSGLTSSTHWNYTNPVRPGAKEEYIVIDGERVLNHGHQNVDFVFRYYLEHNMGIGSCSDEEAFIDSWCKSWGIATTGLWLNPKTEGEFAHTYVSYYEPQSMSWKAYQEQLNVVQGDSFVYIYKMPVSQKRFLWTGVLKENPNRWDGGMVHIIKNLSISEFKSMFASGVPTSEMKQWLLYS